MPLQRQTITLPFAFGVDTKTDPKQVALGKLAQLENGVFGTLKQVRKRNGYTAISRTVSAGSGFSQVQTASALTSFRGELLMVGRTNTEPEREQLLSYADGSAQWVSKGTLTTCSVARASVSQSTIARTCVDGATTDSGLQLYAWEEAGDVRYAVVDSTSGQLVVASGLVAADAIKPRVVPYVGGALVYWLGAADGVLYVSSLQPSIGATLTTPTALTSIVPGTVNTTTAVAADRCFDVALFSGQLLVAFANDVGDVTVRRYDTSSPLTVSAQEAVATSAAPNVLALASDPVSETVLVVAGIGLDLEAAATDALLTAPFSAVVTLATSAVGAFTQAGLVAVPTAPASTRWRLWASTVNATTVAHTDGSTLTSSSTTLTVTLASRPWLYAGRSFALLAYISNTTGAPSPLQNQFVALSDSTTAFEPIARVLYTTAAGAPVSAGGGQATLPSAFIDGGDVVRIAALEAGTLGTAVGDVQTTTGVVALDFDLSGAPLSDNRSEIGGSLIMGGGLPMQYDGVGPVELGFFHYPDRVLFDSVAGGGNLSAGDYQYVATYEWADNNGLVHRSAPSLPFPLTLASPNQTVTLEVSTLALTCKQARSPVKVVLYRTQANGSTFYRASSLANATDNDPTVFSVTISDDLSDADLATRPQLYTTGGVVENSTPGALDGLAVHRGRLWGIDATNRLRLWFSRQVMAGAPVEFSDVLFFDVDPRGGDVVAVASLDDKLVVFKRTQIFMIAGQGPDATGSQNDFSDAVLVTTDAGCLDARSIVTTPVGLIFQSSKGLYLLDRSMAASYVGADVEAYNSATVESSQLLPTVNQVRFVLSTGVALVFDYLVGQWSVFTNHPAVDSVVWLDRFCWLRSNGSAMREDPTRFDDDGAFVSLKIKTGWISFELRGNAGATIAADAGRSPQPLQGFQRVRRLLVLGEYAGPHELRVQVGFDYSPAQTQDVTVQPVAPTFFGGVSPYGNEAVFGGEWPLYQWRVDLERQKCQAVQVTIFDEREGPPSSGGVQLSALSLELGVKPGTTRVPNNRIIG